jgi:hypothetical protein
MDASRSRRAPRSDFVELRGGMRRIGSDQHSHTDVHALPRHVDPGLPLKRRRRNPAAPSNTVGMASFASQQPIARVAVSGSAKLQVRTCDRRHHHAISAEYARFLRPHERQAPTIQLAAKHRDPRRARRQPGGKTGQEWCDVMVTLCFADCTHRMRLGGSRQRLGNGGCRQRVYDAGNRSTRPRKRRSICISAGPYRRSAAESAGRERGPSLPSVQAAAQCPVPQHGAANERLETND